MKINIKKRTIIAILFTIIVVIMTHNFWLIFKPMIVDIQLESKNPCNIEVQLNKKNNDEFKRISKKDTDVNNINCSTIHFEIKNIKFPKKLKIIITTPTKAKPLIIKSISLKNGKYIIKDFKKINVSGAESKIINNELMLIPTDNIIKLTYKDTLNIRTSTKFDFKMLIILVIITYLFAYKLSNYAAEFNTIGEKSRIEIVFLSIFFIFLFIPMSYINNESISEKENRTLAVFKPLINENNELNLKFGENFEAWFNDRFFLRETFIKIYDKKWIFTKNWKTKGVIKGKDGWLFYAIPRAVESYTNSTIFTEDELIKITNYLLEIDNYCKSHNKHFFFLIAPDKSKIYNEYYSDNIKRTKNISKAEQLIEYLDKNSNINVIYPKDWLIKNKDKGLLYWKQDTHWNELGAYYAYLEIMNEIKKYYKEIPIYTTDKYIETTNEGDLYKMTPSHFKKVDKTIYKIPKISNTANCTNKDMTEEIITCQNNSLKYNILFFRDSFSDSLIPYITKSFKTSKFLKIYKVIPNSMENANIIVLEVVERNLPDLAEKSMGK